MIEFVAYLAAQDRTQDLAHQALPNAPVVLQESPTSSRTAFLVAARARLSATLRRVADRIEPGPAVPKPAPAGC